VSFSAGGGDGGCVSFKVGGGGYVSFIKVCVWYS